MRLSARQRYPSADRGPGHADQSARRRASERRGRHAELIAAAWLLVRGYRILERRARSPFGEIDLVAVRGRRLAFIEVKHRADLADAVTSVSQRQASRIARAGEHWLRHHPRYRTHMIGLDSIFLARGRWPRHVRDNLQPG